MKRRLWLIAAVAVGAAATGWLAPLLLRQVGFFRVRQVEVVGVRYLPPESVVVALQLAPDQNLFDGKQEIERRARALPGIVSARVERRLPGTLRVVVNEREAVALAPGPRGLVALDADGRPLPYDPAATGLDLPIVPRADTVVARTLWLLRTSDSTLFREVDSARRSSRGAVLLEVGSQEIILGSAPSRDELQAVSAVRQHLAATGRRFRQLDARFAGRVIARRSGA